MNSEKTKAKNFSQQNFPGSYNYKNKWRNQGTKKLKKLEIKKKMKLGNMKKDRGVSLPHTW